MRARGPAPIIWRGEGCSQIGSEPGLAHVLEGLSAGEQRFLEQLRAADEPGWVARAARVAGIEKNDAERLVALLTEVGALTHAPAPHTADERYWDLLSDAPRERSTRLRGAVVGLVGSGAPALEIAGLLEEAGVGTVLPQDAPLAAWLEENRPRLRVRAPAGTVPDLVISLEAHVVDPVRARSLAQAGTQHLPVVVREASIRVGPTLGPGAPVCAVCLDLAERDADPAWPAVATQLRLTPAPPTERLLLHQAAALATRAGLDALLGEAWWARSVELSGRDAVGLERRWTPHPECLCSSRLDGAAQSPHSEQDGSPELAPAQ